MRIAAGFIAAAVILASASLGRAQSSNPMVDEAKEAYADLRFDDALAKLDDALARGDSDPATVAEIYMLSGEISATLGKRKDATEAYKRALVINPDLELGEGVSPKLVKPFEAAKDFLNKNQPIKVRHAITSSDPPTVALVVVSDPLGMVVAAKAQHWDTKGNEGVKQAGGKERIDVVLPKGTAKVVLFALDRHGNRLAEVGSPSSPIELEVEGEVDDGGGGEPPPPPPPKTDDGGGTPFYANWILWGGVAVVAAGVGAWAGLQAKSAMDDLDAITQESNMHEFSEAQALEDKAKSRALVANIGLGVALGTGVVAAILFVKSGKKQNKEDSSGELDAVITPTADRDSVGVSAMFRF